MLFNVLLSLIPLYTDTINIRVVSHNTLNLSCDDINRVEYLIDIYSYINPDIILLQEIIDEAVCDTLVDRLNSDSISYSRAIFFDGPDTDNMLIYRTSKIVLLEQDTIKTDLRDISEYIVEIGDNTLYLYSCHLKASSGTYNEQRRLAEATVLREYMNEQIPEFGEFLVAGDMNFYYDEPAYYTLIDSTDQNRGRAEDPLGIAANWHNNLDYAYIHTQSTREFSFGGGASGGMDDRFDFIFTSHGINNNSGFEYIENSYHSFGNDGQHFNNSINEGINDSVPQNIADALYFSSDHLPVYVDIVSISSSGVNEGVDGRESVISIKMYGLNRFKIHIKTEKANSVHVDIYNTTGQKVFNLYRGFMDNCRLDLDWNGKDAEGHYLPSGMYFIRVKSAEIESFKKVIILK